MLPVSTKDVVEFTPVLDEIATLTRMAEAATSDQECAQFADRIARAEERRDAEPQPCFRLAIASHFQRAAFRRDLKGQGATYPGDAELYKALRDDLRDLAPYNLEALLSVVDEVEAATVEADPDALRGLEAITRLARSAGGQFAAMEGDREYFMTVAPIIACRHFLLGWSGVKANDGSDAPFERRRDRTTDETLSHLTEAQIFSVGFKIMGLMRPDKDQEKNSGSPSRSASSPRPTEAATKLLTDQPGSSSASGSSETPAAA